METSFLIVLRLLDFFHVGSLAKCGFNLKTLTVLGKQNEQLIELRVFKLLQPAVCALSKHKVVPVA